MDNVAFGHIFAFTGIDISAKEADVLLWPALTSEDGVALLQTALSRRFTGRVEVLENDGGLELKGALAKQARDYCDRHRMPALTKRTNRPISKASAAHYARNARAGGHDELPRLIPDVETFLARYH